MSSFTRRLVLRLRRRLTDTEDPNYTAPRYKAVRKTLGNPYRRVSPGGYHYTRNACSPAPGKEKVAKLHVPWHLLTVPVHAGKKGSHTRAQRKLIR